MFLTLDSENAKVGPCAATYLPIASTCPVACPLRGEGCYAEHGHVGYNVRRLEREMDGLNGDTVALLEAAEIRDGAARLRRQHRAAPLRLHVSGDASTAFRASSVAAACAMWPGPVWAYTHAWRDVPRAAWGGVSVLASCESLEAARRALDAGYAPAVVVAEHPTDGRAYTNGDIRVIPCPQQTRGVQCVECRLCFDATSLHARRAAIAFAAHGGARKRTLNVIRG